MLKPKCHFQCENFDDDDGDDDDEDDDDDDEDEDDDISVHFFQIVILEYVCDTLACRFMASHLPTRTTQPATNRMGCPCWGTYGHLPGQIRWIFQDYDFF